MPPPTLLPRQSLSDDASNIRNTFSSWDSCMSEAYCKWPAIIGIIIGSLIVISIVWCCARCLCCGAECCCGCLSCFNRCCPSPRSRKNDGYQQTPPQPQPYGGYGYLPQPAPMMYGGNMNTAYGGYQGPQTATFDAPSRTGAKYNEDALPAMPSWDQAQKRHVEEEVEMEKLEQEDPLLHHQDQRTSGGRFYNKGAQETGGDLGAMQAGPYHDYDQHQQFVASPTTSTAYPPTYHSRPQESVYGDAGYAPSVAPSYHTTAPAQHMQMQMPSVGRKPVQGSWRDV